MNVWADRATRRLLECRHTTSCWRAGVVKNLARAWGRYHRREAVELVCL